MNACRTADLTVKHVYLCLHYCRRYIFYHKSVVFAGTDFQLITVGIVSVTNDPNDSGRCFMINIIDDGDPEGTEQFTISFVVDFIEPVNVDARITRNPIQATIFIEDNDGKLH